MTNYLIREETLEKTANAIRKKYKFEDKINPVDFPIYISNDSDDFWLTHFNTTAKGGGSIYTETSDFTPDGETYNAVFVKSDLAPNAYTLDKAYNYLSTIRREKRYVDDLNLLTRGMTYYTSTPDYEHSYYPDRFKDDRQRLTDGAKSNINGDTGVYSAWSGHETSPMEIVFDLGSVKSVGECIIYGTYNFWGIQPITKMAVFTSDTGEADTYTKQGEQVAYTILPITGKEFIQNGEKVNSKMYTMTVHFDSLIEARYVKIQLYGKFIWIDEVEVYGNISNTFYGYKNTIQQINVCNNLNVWQGAITNKSYSVLCRPISGKSYYSVVADGYGASNSISNLFTNGDKILVYEDILTFDSLATYAIINDVSVELLFTNEPVIHNLITFPNNGFVYQLNAGAPAQSAVMSSKIASWVEGNQFIFEGIDFENKTIPTNTPTLSYDEDGYNCTAKYDILEQDSIVVDGFLNDSGWNVGGWYDISSHNGTYADSIIGDLNYRYKIRTDEEYLYLGFISKTPIVTGQKDFALPTRLWLKSKDSEATIYTHFYGVTFDKTNIIQEAKRNTSLTANSPENIANSSLETAWFNDENGFRFELKVRLDEFGGTNEFYYFISHANVDNGQAVTLYGQQIADAATNLPFRSWDDNAATYVATINEQITSDEMIAMIEEVL